MNRHLADDELVAAIDAAAETDGPVRLHGHLASCASCRRRLVEFETTLALTKQLPQPTVLDQTGEAFTQATSQRLFGPKTTPAWRPVRTAWRPAMAGALATGALAAALAFFFVPTGVTQSLRPVVTTPVSAVVSDAVHADADDEQELATMLDTYLFETASTDELLLELDGLSDDEYYALLEE